MHLKNLWIKKETEEIIDEKSDDRENQEVIPPYE